MVTDGYGRALTIGRLKPSDRRKVFEFVKNVSPPVYVPMLVAASVRTINASGENTSLSFPKTLAEIDARLDVLGQKGLDAAEEGMAKLDPPDTKDAETEMEKVKNSPGTAGLDRSASC